MRSEHDRIPEDLRVEAYLRDNASCRVCGKYLGERAGLHHIHFGGDYTGMGGRRVHEILNVVTICWLPGDPAWKAQSCHARVHSDKNLWLPLLETAVATPGVTAFQLRRWGGVQPTSPGSLD